MKSCQKNENPDFSRTQMEKETIFRKLRACGGRITAQRKILLDIILEEECVCCKEIYYKAIKKDPAIGIATVYRMVRSLEDIGAIRRNKMYEIQYGKERIEENALADKILARHSFFLKILVEAGVDQQQAEKEASMLEYILSDESFDKLKVYMEKGTWENGIIIAVLLILVFTGIRSGTKHFKGQGGCCGGSSQIRTKRKN